MGARELVFDIFAIDRASKVFSKVAGEADGMGAKVESAGKVAREGMLLAGAAAVGVGLKSLEMGAHFQQSMTLLQTGAGESAANLGKVSDGILKMAGEVGYMPAELAKGMYLIESAGFHGAAGLTVLRAAAEGAKADGADLQVVGDALTTVMTDLHAPTAQAATVMSQMVRAVGLGKMRMDDLAGSIHSVLPNASAAGLSFAQVGGALATMTAEGIGAEQASQNLNHTIVKLLAPTQGMTSAMASYGLNADVVKRNIGKEGLTGTFEMLSQAILNHMGPAGLTLRNAFNQSQAAAADARKELAAMPPAVEKLSQAYMDGKVSLGDWRKEVKALPADQAALAMQFKSAADRAHGFSDALKSGKSDAQTFSGAMKDMLGDQTGLQVALHLTGDHMATFQANVKAVGATTAEAGGHVRDWATIQKNLSQQIDKDKASVAALATAIGIKLLPAATSIARDFGTATDFMTKHQTVAVALLGTMAGLGAAFLGAKVYLAAYSAAQTVATAATALSSTTFGTWVGVMSLNAIGALKGVIAGVREWTVVQAALDVVLDANPIGIVVMALAALVAGLVYAYTHSEKFRIICTMAWDAVKIGVLSLALVAVTQFQFMANVWMTVVGTLLDGAAKAFGWVPGVGPKLQAAAAQFGVFKDSANSKLDQIKNSISMNIKTSAADMALQKFRLDQESQPILLHATVVSIQNKVSRQLGAGAQQAVGSDYAPGGMTLVGERGPELVEMPTGSRTHTAQETARLLGGSGRRESEPAPINLTVHVQNPWTGEEVQGVVTKVADSRVANGLAKVRDAYGRA